MAEVKTVWAPQAGPQHALIKCPAREVFFGGARGGGKVLSCKQSYVLTPKGWKLNGDLRVGDVITDPTTGGTQRVIGTFPQGVVDIYRITCDDGAQCLAGWEHLWAYKLPNHHRPRTKPSNQRDYAHSNLGASSPDDRWNNYRIGNTGELIEALKKGFEPRIPLTEPVLFSVNGRTGTALDPYFLGLYLGDGTVGSLVISTGDDETRQYLRQFGYEAKDKRIDSNGGHIHWGPASRDLSRRVRQWINNHGLGKAHAQEKFIPGYVLTAEVSYRHAFLQGLMDSDGTVDERGRCYFTSTSESLCDGVADLVRGLGGKAYKAQKQPYYTYKGERKAGLVAYNLHVQLPKTSAFFRLSRKKARCTDSWNGGYEMMRAVRHIEFAHRDEAMCIAVENLHGLYITDNYIVTHNTDAIIGKCALRAERYGKDENQIIFRRELPAADDVIARAEQIFGQLGARYNGQDRIWRWPNGARTRVRPLERVSDADKYQGQNITLAVVEEAGQYPDPGPIDRLHGVLRSAAGIPTQLILTGNPGGAGQHWLRRRYIDPLPSGMKIMQREVAGGRTIPYVYIPSRVADNRILIENDPEYVTRLHMVGSDELVRAWLHGDWDAIEGAFFDCWSHERHVIKPAKLPEHWTRFRSIDWGSAAPFSVGWWAVATDDWQHPDGRIIPRGALIRYREWYGASEPNVGIKWPAEDVAAGIRSKTEEEISYTVADPSMFASDGGPSIAERMHRNGVPCRRGDNKRVGDRGAMGGWDQMRARMLGDEEDRPMLYVFDTCTEFIRTVPLLQHDDTRPEDLDTSSEDHIADESRYACMSRPYRKRKPQKDRPIDAKPTFNDLVKAQPKGKERI